MPNAPTLRFDLVDVFAQARYQGNQLAVFHDAGELSTELMQAMSLETNFSESTFVTARRSETEFDVRIFTPTYEMPFAGHPTLGTAASLRKLHCPAADVVTLHLAVGPVAVRFETERCWLSSPPTRTIKPLETELVARTLSLPASAIDSAFPVSVVSSGPEFIMIPLDSLDSLEAANLDLPAFEPLAADGVVAHVYAFARGSRTGEHALTVRLFFDANGPREDPATGSAACCLGHYIREHNYLESQSLDVTISQGTQCRRPSVLHLSVSPNRIEVGGRVEFIANGSWKV